MGAIRNELAWVKHTDLFNPVFLHIEELVVPLERSVTLPAPGSNGPPATSVALICGILSNTTDYVSTWTTPNSGSFTSADLANTETLARKYRIQNGEFVDAYPQGSNLTITRLSYLDSGVYTCSIAFAEVGNVGQANITLSLLGKYV